MGETSIPAAASTRETDAAGVSADAARPARPLLAMSGIAKSFFGVEVLHGVDLECEAGEVHAIVGENGAGKSTLMKVLAGVHRPDAGRIEIDGVEAGYGDARGAQEAGVSIIYQELSLLPERTVAQNIFVGREPTRRGVVQGRTMERATGDLLRQLRVDDSISPSTPVRALSVAQQQMVEIAKALSFEPRILVMDEPTAALSPHEVRSLFDRVQDLQQRGLAILYISHRLGEVFQLAGRITVLKDGSRVATVRTEEITPPALVRLMVGRELSHLFPDRARSEELGPPKLRVRGGGNARLHDVELEVRAGEIVAVAGLEGSGRTELARAVFGAEPFETGALELNGEPVRIRSPREAIRRGVGFLTEDRKSEGLVLPQSVRSNALLALRSLGGSIRRRRVGRPRPLDELAHDVDLRSAGLDQAVVYLSGGNQQKVVLAKWLATKAEILLFDEPTRGIDVGARAGIHALMRDLARNGAAILMISSELPEVIGMGDRIVVMRDGTVAGELPAGASESEIMLLATGERDPVAA